MEMKFDINMYLALRSNLCLEPLEIAIFKIIHKEITVRAAAI